MMKCVQKELQRVLGCSTESIPGCCKCVAICLGIYALVMLFTFLIASGLALTHSFILSAIFGFLLAVEIVVLSTVFAWVIFLGALYYSAYFVKRGWNRPSNLN